MEPTDKRPACEACGATEGIHYSTHFGWLCDDVRACPGSSWTFASGAKLTFARQPPEDAVYRSAYDTKPWEPGADIPEGPTGRAPVDDDWRRAHAIVAARVLSSYQHEGPDSEDGPDFEGWAERSGVAKQWIATCRLCGLGGDLARSQYGWVHETCLTADDSETDYEALGYPETACGNARLDEVAWLVGFMGRARDALVEKDIRVD